MANTAKNQGKTIDPRAIKQGQKMPEETPVLPSLYKTIGVELLVNESDTATIYIDKPLPEKFWWAEYDIDLEQMYFVTVNARIQGLGFKIWPQQHRLLMNANKVMVSEIATEDGKDALKMPYIIPLVVRTNTLTSLEVEG